VGGWVEREEALKQRMRHIVYNMYSAHAIKYTHPHPPPPHQPQSLYHTLYPPSKLFRGQMFNYVAYCKFSMNFDVSHVSFDYCILDQ
jgi:hypothetical protein